MKTVYIEHTSPEYAHMFIGLGFSLIRDPSKADLICFTGGSDVSPSLYGAASHPYTHPWPERDVREQKVFEEALKNKIPMVGICRGAQFLNVMSGGAMYQHVEAHTRSHEITDLLSGEKVWVSSTHHQMMKPSPEAVLVASSTLNGRREWYEGTIEKFDRSEQDIEVVFYERTQCLCFQPHPEFNGVDYVGMRKYFQGLLNRYFDV